MIYCLHLPFVFYMINILTGNISSERLTSTIKEYATRVFVDVLNVPQLGVDIIRDTVDLIPGINIGIKSVSLRLFDSKHNDVQFYKDMSIRAPNVLSLFTPKYGYNPNKISIFYIHGFIGTSSSPVSTTMALALLSRKKYNVFLVDWSKLNLPPYSVAVQNMKTVGETLAAVLNMAIRKGLIKVSNINLIGFSLGAHLSGYVGRNLVKRPPSIVGLDPAGPEFITNFVAKKLTHLDADIVHYVLTNRFIFGTNFELGMANYNFNGPAVYQPGCLTAICSHIRVVYYFAEAVRNPGSFIAVRCNSCDHFKDGTCDDSRSVIGFPVDIRAKGKYYISTNAEEPFGRGELVLNHKCQ